jgi:hypothetical protein
MPGLTTGQPTVTETPPDYDTGEPTDTPYEFTPGNPSPPGSPGRPPRPRRSDDDLFSGGLGDIFSAKSSTGESHRPLASGWLSETFTTIATRGSAPSEDLSQSQLASFASVGNWELPTSAMVEGDEETRERIAEVEELFGGHGGFEAEVGISLFDGGLFDDGAEDDDEGLLGGGWL